MKKSVVLFITITVIAMSGCSHVATDLRGEPRILTDYRSPSAVYAKTEVESDPYAKTTTIKSPYYRCGIKPPGGWGYTAESKVFLRRISTRSAVQVYQAYVIYRGPGWCFFKSAYDINGQPLEFVTIDKDVTVGDTYTTYHKICEHFAVQLSGEYLETARSTGLDFKAMGKKGAVVFKLPPHYIEGFLNKCHEVDQ